jgi:hypothetical protein
LGPGSTLQFGEVVVLFEPLDESVPVLRSPGTQVLSAVMPPAEDREDVPRRRRPIRVTPPPAAGPSLWLIAALVLGGAIAAFLLLR